MKRTVALILALALIILSAAFVCVADGEGNYPQITNLTPISGGFKINYTASDDAVYYRVFSKTDGTWKALGTTPNTYFECKNLTDRQEYTFTVRGLNENGEYSTDFDSQGFTQSYYNPPVLRALNCTQSGLKLDWEKIEDIDYYDVFLKTSAGWKLLAHTTDTTYTDNTVTSGKQYTYTVKGVTADDSAGLTYHDVKGISRVFIATPEISSFKNLANGTSLTWNKCAGASSYRVFVKTANGWKKLADTSSNTYTHKNLKNNTLYTYTVRALGKAGNTSAIDNAGSANKFFSVPKLISAVPAYGGMRISWNSVGGVNEYTVFSKTASGWKKLAVCDTNTYLDNTAVSGKQYTYTVKCSKNSGANGLSYHDAKGVTGTYVAAPEISGFENLADSVKINIKKSVGAYSYKVFVKTANGWKAIASTKTLTANHKGVKNNVLYTYTVRAMDKNGKYVSACNPTGKANRFFAPPAINSLTHSGTANTLEWDENNYVSSYRVYKKVYGGAWAVLADINECTYTDNALQSNVLYTYTLRYFDNAKKPVSSIISNTKYYYNGAVANGKITYNGKTLGFTNGVILKGLVKQNGKYYFYNANGILQKNGIVGTSKAYYYADKNGVIDMTFRDAVKYKNTLWIVQNGKAKKVVSEYDKTLYRAFVMVRACTNKSMTKEQKLLASFRYIQKITVEKNPRIPHYTGKNWHLIYANDIFVNKTGNCMSYGAAFAFMAKAIGYTDVYCCNSGGHGWAEVNHLVYDPEWDIHHKNSFYGISYDAKCGNDYKGAISAGYWWMRVKI